MEELIINTLSTLGFPAALCLYLVIKMQRTLERLTEAINNLNRDVEKRETQTQRQINEIKTECNALKLIIEQRNYVHGNHCQAGKKEDDGNANE